MKIGLFFGSFNPVHIGHLALANYFVEFSDLKKVCFVVSPHNPLKKRQTLLKDYHRLHLVRLAIEDFRDKFLVSDIEFKMPKPSYTIDTLIYLQEKFPDNDYVILMGADNLLTLHKWKNYIELIKKYEFYVYPRSTTDLSDLKINVNYKMFDAPKIQISSSFIRRSIAMGKNVDYFMYPAVAKYVSEMNFYKKAKS